MADGIAAYCENTLPCTDFVLTFPKFQFMHDLQTASNQPRPMSVCTSEQGTPARLELEAPKRIPKNSTGLWYYIKNLQRELEHSLQSTNGGSEFSDGKL